MTPKKKAQRKLPPPDDSPLSPRWEQVRQRLRSPTLFREQEQAIQELLNKSAQPTNGNGRDKATRARMHGYECPCCSGYYDALGLTGEERQKRINQISRHRGWQEMPRTPPRYWDTHFPSIEEQKALGLYVESDSPLFKRKNPNRRVV